MGPVSTVISFLLSFSRDLSDAYDALVCILGCNSIAPSCLIGGNQTKLPPLCYECRSWSIVYGRGEGRSRGAWSSHEAFTALAEAGSQHSCRESGL